MGAVFTLLVEALAAPLLEIESKQRLGQVWQPVEAFRAIAGMARLWFAFMISCTYDQLYFPWAVGFEASYWPPRRQHPLPKPIGHTAHCA